ncbi:MAG: diguanylate cyclase [Methylococcaceae bacterium]
MTDSQQPMILIVDDVPTNVQILAQALSSLYRIKVANSGIDALEIAQREQPDLILLDVMMADMDGFEVCRSLKASTNTDKIAVIFVTAKNAESDEELGLNLGAVDYITKPYVLPVVTARIRNHIRLKQQADLLESLALLDALTHIANRRRFDETLATEWKRAKRDGTLLSLIMIDIDYFKDYNDHYGHGAGDYCLQKVAAELAKSLDRPSDFVARYGGEEFVVILPDTHQIAALQVAERLRERIERLGLAHAYSATKPVITISVGLATQDNIQEYFLPKILIDAADNALYIAKKSGRNRVCAH